MIIREINSRELNDEEFIEEKVIEISEVVGDDLAINALSGGVDSSVVTMLAHKALGENLKTYFIDNGLMRKDEPQRIVSIFQERGVHVELVEAQEEFFTALAGITDPEEKREAITQTFYKKVFRRLVIESGAKHLFQGTILTDIDETVAGIKRQHNVFEQLGIDPEKEFGYKIIEPLKQLRKDGVRIVGQAIGLPEEIYNRPPFPGPALAARVIGEVTPEKVELVRQATVIMEEELAHFDAFQNMAILHDDRVTGVRDNKREFGKVIQIRSWKSVDARTATPMKIPFETLLRLGERIPNEVPGVVNVTYNLSPKPPSTMEAI
ncbi:MAG: ExsB family transcriptional regulator [Deltaproteobacteria bacterium]|nr:ExsB family transcriptional regulator [Deltaproteobacteria bacterium]MBW2053120.1 ExsB family transcriptional regulator [Deltaproteobacteria bacterium]MBW2141453.1 ExsB family transcriptional regulator [Deltaproteobacteria bacterium]MBW2322576.1 ExsB family transcriptional regulator [Deltaproteobacteria bacterium]